jgi:hypothetical protein
MGLLGACAQSESNADRRQRAVALWQERCKSAGEFIHKPVRDVEGVVLLTLRHKFNRESQFELDDPYGHDSVAEEYLMNFLRGFYHQRPNAWPADYPPRIGYQFVEARDPKDGQLYRYTGRLDEPWQTNKSYLKGYLRFVADRVPIAAPTARYGVRFDDISTRQERELWIAGSSLKVVDLQTQEVVAERVGYMVDLAQGSRAGQRSPWLFAAENACPDFFRNYPPAPNRPQRAMTAQFGQTLDFVEKVLKPLP